MSLEAPGSRRRHVAIDRLVAAAFLPVPTPSSGRRPRLVHLDGDPSNCHASNLTWQGTVTVDDSTCAVWQIDPGTGAQVTLYRSALAAA